MDTTMDIGWKYFGLWLVMLATLLVATAANAQSEPPEDCDRQYCLGHEYGPQTAVVPCSFLPLDFIECDPLLDHEGNVTAFNATNGLGCIQFGGQKAEEVQLGLRMCRPLGGITCSGEQNFTRAGFPCVKYNGHYFITTLMFSVLLGALGMDRFYLGHTGTAIGKLLTLGGVGIWWVVDIVLLVTGNLLPEDGSNWMTYA